MLIFNIAKRSIIENIWVIKNNYKRFRISLFRFIESVVIENVLRFVLVGYNLVEIFKELFA